MNLYFPCRPCLPYTGVWGGRIFFYTWTLTSSPFVTSGSRLSSWICRNGPRSKPQELSGVRMKPFQASQTLVPPAPRPYICLTEERTLGLFSLGFLYRPVSCLVSLHHSSFVNWERVDLLAPAQCMTRTCELWLYPLPTLLWLSPSRGKAEHSIGQRCFKGP